MTLDAAGTGKVAAMTIGEFLSSLDVATLATIQRNFSASANATLLLEFVLGLPASLVFVFFGISCLWYAHRRDTVSDGVRQFGY